MANPESRKGILLKEGVARCGLIAWRFVFRYLTPSYRVRKKLWDGIIGPRLAWRELHAVIRTKSQAKFAVTTNDVIQGRLYFFGFWEPHVEALINARLSPGDTFVDVGANLGYFSILASGIVGPAGRVISIEASSEMFSHLTDTLSRNRCSNVRAIHGAAGDKEYNARFFLPAKSDENCGLGSMVRESANYEEVVCNRLDKWLSPEETRSIRLVKIDVEGAEALVLQGMKDMLGEIPRNAEILAEISPGGSCENDLFGLLEAHGFSAYALPADNFDDYLRHCRQTALTPLTRPLVARTDVLFTRVSPEEIPAVIF